MTRLPPVLSRYDLPQAELLAAQLDGEVYRVDDCFSPIDEIDQCSHRALALLAIVPAKLIAEQRTAAWVLGALSHPPSRHQFCADIGSRVRPTGLIATTIREVVIDRADLTCCAGLELTTPLRTAIDIARFSPSFAGDELRMIRALMNLGRFTVDDCRTVLDRRRNLPNKRRALVRLAEAAEPDQPPLTR